MAVRVPQQIHAITSGLGSRQCLIDGFAHRPNRGAVIRRLAGGSLASQAQQRRQLQPPEQFLVALTHQIVVTLRLMNPGQPAHIRVEP